MSESQYSPRTDLEALTRALHTGDTVRIAAVLFPSMHVIPAARPDAPDPAYDATPIAVHLLRHVADGLERGWIIPQDEWDALLNFMRSCRPDLFAEKD